MDIRPPLVQHVDQRLTLVWRKHDQTSKDIAGVWVKTKHEFSHDTEVGATTANAVEEVGVLCLAGLENASISNDNGRL